MLHSSMPWPRAVEAAAFALALFSRPTQGANTASSVQSPNLDLSNLGRVALTGDFDAISVYTYQDQSENAFSTNGSQALLTQMPNGLIDTLVSSDGLVASACSYVMSSGAMTGVIVGGNFTMLKNIPAQGVALWDPANSSGISPLTGLNGSVNAVYCDRMNDRVFVGGSFRGANSTNAIVWVGGAEGSWDNVPFEGFDGPVNAISKAPDSNNVIFAGQFEQLGNVTETDTNSTVLPDLVVNIGGLAATVEASGSSSLSGFSDPKNIICKTSGQDGAGNTWLAPDNQVATWKVTTQYGYEPTRLRLWNTHYQGRGTKTWRFTSFPGSGPNIMNFTYTDPADGQNKTCDATCPLSNDTNVPYQDFYFVNVIGMSIWQLDFYEWYGQGAGLDGVELVQNANYVYAVSDFNSPQCSNTSFPSNATQTGNWQVTPSGQSIANYLTADLKGPGVDSASAAVTFLPTIENAGRYRVNVYTPGCQPQGTCGSRGVANVTGFFQSGQAPVQMNISQTNQYEKYDSLYLGDVDIPSSSFRPYVAIQPLDDQNDSISLVALRVQFDLMEASGNSTVTTTSRNSTFTTKGLNGLFEIDPNNATVNTDFNSSAINRAGQNLSANAEITSMATIGTALYIAGNFSTNDFRNIFAFQNSLSNSLAQGGLNDRVNTLTAYGNQLFVGGTFNNTRDGNTPLAQNVVAYDTSSNAWNSLGGGVNGPVTSIVPLELSINGAMQSCITVNGAFNKVLPGNNLNGFNATDGFAVWVPSYNNWMQNLNVAIPAIRGQLTSAINYTASTGNGTLLAGTIASQGMAIQDVVALSSSNGNASISSLGLQEPQVAASGQKIRNKAVDTSGTPLTLSGAVTGLFITDGGRNMSVVAGNFQTNASNGTAVNNLVFINTASNGDNTITGIAAGLDTNSTFLALVRNDNTLFAGGAVSGEINGQNINGLINWDLNSNSFSSQQPAALGPVDSHVNTLSYRPSSTDLYVGGNFTTAGAQGCPGLCLFSNGGWSVPGQGFAGVVNTMMWQGNTKLLVAGNFTNGGNKTVLAAYDTGSQSWSTPDNVNQLPGPVSVLTPANADNSQYWLAGTATNGSAFFMKFDGTNFRTVSPQLGAGSTIRGLSVVSLTQGHSGTDLLDSQFAVLMTGQLSVPNFGNASAALYNGSTITPFILSTAGNGPGSMSQVFSERSQTFSTGGGHLALGFVVLIALAIALGLIFLLVAAGMLLERYRRRAEGYRPAPQNFVEKTANMGRIPPDQLLSNLSRGTEGPRI